MGWFSIAIDQVRNEAAHGVEAVISTDQSRVPVWVIPTNEELWIARDTFLL